MGYLFRRIGPPQAAWNWQPTGVPPADAVAETPAAFGNVSRPLEDPRRGRTANQVYTITPRLAAIGDAAEIPPRTFIPPSAPGYRRAAAQAYLVTANVPPADAEVYIVPSRLPDGAALFRPRAANTAFQINVRPQITDEVAGLTISLLPSAAPGYRRTSNTAYAIAVQFQISDEVYGIRTSELPSRAPGPLRAASTAYFVSATFPPADEVHAIRVWELPSVARGPLRAANSAYFVSASSALVGVVTEDPEIMRRSLPETAPGARRAASSAYLVINPLPPADQPYGITITSITALAPAARRAASQAYFVASTFPPADQPYEITVRAITHVARGPLRAANPAYFVSTVVPPADVVQFLSTQLLPSRAPAAVRASADSYWIPNTISTGELTIVVSEPIFVPALQPTTLEIPTDIQTSAPQLSTVAIASATVLSPVDKPPAPRLGSRRT